MFKVKILAPNKTFFVKNIFIRSPFECIVEKEDLNIIKLNINSYGLQEYEYSIKEYNSIQKIKKSILYNSNPIKNAHQNKKRDVILPNSNPIKNAHQNKKNTNTNQSKEQNINHDLEVTIENLSNKARVIIDNLCNI